MSDRCESTEINSSNQYTNKIYQITIGQETPHTISKEWEEATNEYLKSQNSNPISGISSEGYKGTGYVVSK